MSSQSKSNDQVISESELEGLNHRQREMYSAKLARFAEYLKTKGKDPKKGIGYTATTERVSRFHSIVKWIWSSEGPSTEFTVEHADTAIEALDSDSLRKCDGSRYAETSKRKMSNVLVNWFEFKQIDWEPDVTFTDERPTNNADPYRKSELQQLWQTSLTYKSIPRYNNLTPEERDRWKAHIAQELGKPKSDVTPDDWDEINNCWKIPSLIRTNREAGWRPDLVGRLEVDWYDPETKTIYIPAGEAPKNDSAWNQELTSEASLTFENWLEQRENQELYDGRKEVWLTREGNPYGSSSLNSLLRNLMEEAGIESRGRKLVWYSFRHSIGTYVYHEYKDLRVVAESLRQNSRAAADCYVHPLPELKREAAGIM